MKTWPKVAAVGVAAATLIGCRDGVVTSSRQPTVAGRSTASMVQAGRLSFDVLVESGVDGQAGPRATRIHIEQSPGADGRSLTTYEMNDPERFLGTIDNRRRIVKVEVDDDGNSVATRADGSQRRVAPLGAEALAKLANGPLPAREPYRSQIQRARLTLARGTAKGGMARNEMIRAVLLTAERRDATVSALAKQAGSASHGTDGFDHYVTQSNGLTADVSVDPLTKVVRNVVFSRAGREAARATFDYATLGDGRMIRWRSTLTRAGDNSTPPGRTSVTYSNISVDGTEVRP